jgi:hypothetical protein
MTVEGMLAVKGMKEPVNRVIFFYRKIPVK